MEWKNDHNPDHHKMVLLFDLLEGVHIGFYDLFSGKYFTKDRFPLNMVAGWCNIPNIPKFNSTIKDNIISSNGRLLVKSEESKGADELFE